MLANVSYNLMSVAARVQTYLILFKLSVFVFIDVRNHNETNNGLKKQTNPAKLIVALAKVR